MKKKKTIVMIFSLLISFLFWAYVVTYVNPVIDKAISGIPIQILNADSLYSQGLVLSGVSHVSTTVTVSGNRSDVSLVTEDDIIATLDVSGYGEGDNVIRLDVTVPSSVTVKDVKNSGKVTAHIDAYVTEAKPYEFLYSGQIPDGYELGEISLDPESITVTGAKPTVDEVQSIRAILNLSNVTREGYTFTSAVAATSSDSKEVKDVILSDTSVTGTAFLYEVKTLPLTLVTSEELPEGYELKVDGEVLPIKVRSRYLDLSGIETIETEPIDVSLWLNAITSGEELPGAVEITVSPIFPEGVELAEDETIAPVSVAVVPMEEAEEEQEETTEKESQKN